jgi:hypothetical protein
LDGRTFRPFPWTTGVPPAWFTYGASQPDAARHSARISVVIVESAMNEWSLDEFCKLVNHINDLHQRSLAELARLVAADQLS